MPTPAARPFDAGEPRRPDSLPYLLICPTQRDHRELSRLGLGPGQILAHSYATDSLERIAGAVGGSAEPVADPLDEIELLLRKYRDRPLAGVISSDDYPGTTIASVVAHSLGLPAPDPSVNLLLQHKYHSRREQRRLTPEATPAFALLDADGEATPALDYPFFIKPVKSFFSIGAQAISEPAELARFTRDWRCKAAFFVPFERLLQRYSSLPMGGHLLIEKLLSGQQVTVEGYAYGDEIEILGIVDSVFAPGTIAFVRFEYPSSAPAPIQAKMADIAHRLISGVGYRDGLFNIEMFYDAASDAISIIEVNPRIASQFADLYEKVDGYNSYQILLDLACGRKPKPCRGAGRHAFAASCVLRRFEDAIVTRVPAPADIAAVEHRHPDARIELVVAQGRTLSEEMQDGHSYRYGVVNLGGRDRAEVECSFAECRQLLNFEFAPVRAGVGEP